MAVGLQNGESDFTVDSVCSAKYLRLICRSSRAYIAALFPSWSEGRNGYKRGNGKGGNEELFF